MLRKIPNILTVGRILIVPFFVLAFYLPGFYGDLTALILFIVQHSNQTNDQLQGISINYGNQAAEGTAISTSSTWTEVSGTSRVQNSNNGVNGSYFTNLTGLSDRMSVSSGMNMQQANYRLVGCKIPGNKIGSNIGDRGGFLNVLLRGQGGTKFMFAEMGTYLADSQ